MAMLSSLKWFRPSNQNVTDVPKTQRGLPAAWYRDPAMFELERRAIFSKSWLLITHKNRFTKPGDFLRVTEAGFSFFLCLDRSGNVGGFHNVCRHRGFPIIHDDSGNAKILSCKYHGWSYGINGKLAKAPYFEDFQDFDKANNNLLPVHVHIDVLGFVWVNLESKTTPTIPWAELFEGVDTRPAYNDFNFNEYKLDHTWGMQGEYNWKTLGDNYNECLHCKTAHPDTNGLVDITAYRVEAHKGSLQHYNRRQEDGLNKDKITIISTYYYPNACMTVSPHFFYLMRCVPTSVNTCSMEYEVYRHKDASDDDFNKIDQLFKRILKEDKWLCNETQKNLDGGVYVNGQMHPQFESGPLYLQSLVRAAVRSHWEEERRLGGEIWPTRQDTEDSESTNSDTSFCSGLSCDQKSEQLLAW